MVHTFFYLLRCDALMRICEKDNLDFEQKEKKDAILAKELAAQRLDLEARIAEAKAELNRVRTYIYIPKKGSYLYVYIYIYI